MILWHAAFISCVLQRAVDSTGLLGVTSLLCVCLCMQRTHDCVQHMCVYVHTGMQKCRNVCSTCIWAYVHLFACVCGLTRRWLLTCAAVIVTFYPPCYRKFPCSSRQSRKWLLLMPAQSIVCLSAPFTESLELNGTEVWKMSTSKWVQASTNPQIMMGRQGRT